MQTEPQSVDDLKLEAEQKRVKRQAEQDALAKQWAEASGFNIAVLKPTIATTLLVRHWIEKLTGAEGEELAILTAATISRLNSQLGITVYKPIED